MDVTITSLMPGPTDTDFFHKAGREHTTMVQEISLDEPAKVARHGYDALIKGETKVIPGIKNKLQAGMANLLPDKTVAKYINKQMQPSAKKKEE